MGSQQLFTHYQNGVKPEWRYTGAPDADARTIQATKLGDFLTHALWDK